MVERNNGGAMVAYTTPGQEKPRQCSSARAYHRRGIGRLLSPAQVEPTVADGTLLYPSGETMAGRIGLFDQRAKRVLALAQDEAWRVFHHDSIGPEHLLLGVLREVTAGGVDPKSQGSAGAVALNALGVDILKTRTAFEGLRGRGDPQQQLDEIPFTPEGNKVIDLAPAEAKSLGAENVTPTHVLLAVLREPGKADAILQGLGLSPETVRQKIIGESGS